MEKALSSLSLLETLRASGTLGFGLAPFFEIAAKLAWVTDRDWYRETMAEYKLNSKGSFTIDSW